jgi:polyisoprenoid-binding protein YceI
MTTVTSPESQRDGQFHGRIMDTATFPTATFTLTEPIELGSVPVDGEEVPHTVTGDLTLRGVTREVTFELIARRNGANIEANGTIAVDFDDFQIPDASGGPARVGRDGELELLLVFTR